MWRRGARIFVENVLIRVGLESRSIYSQCFVILQLPKIIADGYSLCCLSHLRMIPLLPQSFPSSSLSFFLFQFKELSCCETKSYGFNRKNLEGSLSEGQMVQCNVPPPNATSFQGPPMVVDVCNRLSSQTISNRPSSMRIIFIVGGAL